MKMNLKELSTQTTETTTDRIKMRLSENATSMVFQIFTKNIYSNPIGTVVREITSNCFDSHIEAGVNAPVLIKKSIDKETGTIHISFIDYGVGMSPDRIKNIYGVYFESTKRVDNQQIGGFGIGGKTPLAYKRSTGHGEGEYDNSFYVITIFDKVKYSYCIYEGAETPEISLIHSEPTTEHNGTEIRVPVLEKDINTFTKEMVRQLYYFENIIFEGFDDEYRYGETLMNEYQIIRGKTFFYRGTEYSEMMHVCLGRVAYPIDYNVLGLNSGDYRLPLALRLEVGDISVTASRETIDYSEKTIKIIKKKLAEAMKEVIEMLSKQYGNITTLKQYFEVKNDFGRLYLHKDISINVGNLIQKNDIDFSNFKYSFMKMPNDKQLFRFFFNSKQYGKKQKSRYNHDFFEGGYSELVKQEIALFYVDAEFNRKVMKQAYLNMTHSTFYIITKKSQFPLYDIAELFNVQLDKAFDDNGKPVDFVQSLYELQEEYFDIVREYTKNYDKVEVPEDFILDRKNRKNMLSKEMRNTTIPLKFVGGYKERVKLDELFNYNQPIFYGTQEDEGKLRKIYDMYCGLFDKYAPVSSYSGYDNKFTNHYTSNDQKNKKKSIMFIILAHNNIKYMEYCKKAYKPDEFFIKILYRKEANVMTYFQTYELRENWNGVGKLYCSNNFEKISIRWGKKINEVNAFINALPEVSKTTDIGYLKDELSEHFDLTNVQPTKEQKRISKLIAEILKLQESNNNILEYINLPYHNEVENAVLIDVLKKVMVL